MEEGKPRLMIRNTEGGGGVCSCLHYRRPTYKCEDVINANVFPDSQLLNSQLAYYIHGDESRRAQNAIIEFAISLKTRKRNLFTTHLNVGLHTHTYITVVK